MWLALLTGSDGLRRGHLCYRDGTDNDDNGAHFGRG